MNIKEQYNIIPISNSLAMKYLIKNHYLHRKCSASFSFGLFEDRRLIGAICYGSPASRPLCKGICGIEEACNVIELTRLFIEDGTPKNTESYFIGNTIKQVSKEIIVSFAEEQQGHVGTVYQATNWIYTGLSAKHCEWYVDGKKPRHCRHMFDIYGGIEPAKVILGDRLEKRERPQKHRYIYFNCKGRRRKELISKLRYKIIPYPKRIFVPLGV